MGKGKDSRSGPVKRGLSNSNRSPAAAEGGPSARLGWILRMLIFLPLLSYLLVLMTLYLFQERLIFLPEHLPSDFAFDFRVPFVEQDIDFEETKIHSLLFRAENSKGLILYFHGNAGSLATWGEVAQELVERTSWSVWIVDYPGYGKSGGHIHSETQLHSLAQEAFARARKEAPNILIYGRSIGTGLAVKLATEAAEALAERSPPLAAGRPADDDAVHHTEAGVSDARRLGQAVAVILESPYYSLQAVVAEKFPWVPGFLLKYPLRSYQWFSEIKVPILMIHGQQDEVIPFSQSEKLQALNGRSRLVAIPSGHHNDLGASEQYWQAVTEFTAAQNAPSSP